MLATFIEDVTQWLSKVKYDKDITTAKVKEYLEITLPTWLAHFEKITPERDINANELHFASERLTWVDFLVFDMIDHNQSFEEATREAQGEPVDILQNFPRLKLFYKEFKDRPKLHAYLKSDKRHAFKLPYPIIN